MQPLNFALVTLPHNVAEDMFPLGHASQKAKLSDFPEHTSRFIPQREDETVKLH